MAFKKYTVDRIEIAEGGDQPSILLAYSTRSVEAPGLEAEHVIEIKTVHQLDRSMSMEAMEGAAAQMAKAVLTQMLADMEQAETD